MSFREGTKGKCSSGGRLGLGAEPTATGPPALPASAFGRAFVGPGGSSLAAAGGGAALPPLRTELMTRTGMGMTAARTALGEKRWRGATGMEVGTFRWGDNTLVAGMVVIGRTDTVPEI